MRKRTLIPLCLLGGMLSLQSCFDDNYDLSDIDSTVGLQIKNLTIPINLDDEPLDALLDIDDDSQIKKVDGGYAVVEDGTFESDMIHVPGFTATAFNISPIKEQINLQTAETIGATRARTRAGEELTKVFWYDIDDKATKVEVSTDGIDEAIVDIDAIGVNKATLTISIDFDQEEQKLKGYVNELALENLMLMVMPGLDAEVTVTKGTIDVEGEKPEYISEYELDGKNVGMIKMPTTHTKGLRIELVLTINRFTRQSNFVFDAKKHTFDLDTEFKVYSGELVAYNTDLTSVLWKNGGIDVVNFMEFQQKADKIWFVCAPVMKDIEATTFTGKIKYDIDGVDVAPVEIHDMPDILGQEGTDIRLGNPQIYLEVENPIYSQYGLWAQAGMTLTSSCYGQAYTPCTMSAMPFNKPITKYCLAPKKLEAYYKADKVDKTWADAEYREFATLGDVLSGNKMPNKIEIDIEGASLPEQNVQDFPLGNDIAPVKGNYVFFAPLELTDKARIKYEKVYDGWNDEDLDPLVISELKIHTQLVCEVPLDAEIKAYPIDTTGKKIAGTDGKPLVGIANVKPNEQTIDVAIKGEIKHLDGVVIDVLFKGKGPQLRPDQKLKFKDTKVTVSGTYTDEL